VKKRNFFLFVPLFSFLVLSLCVGASAAGTEPPSEPESSVETAAEPESGTEASTESEACTKAYLEAVSDVPPESETSTEPENTVQKGPSPTSTDIITPRYRMYHGRPQYRRWNETKAHWEDPVWVDGSRSGIKKLTLYTGNTMKLKIGLVKPRCASKPVYWKSQKPKVVCAYKNGRILAKRIGIARIAAIHRKTKRTIARIKIVVR